MKTLILVRHAKSSWENAFQTDFERTLNKRGHEDAPFMAQKLINKHGYIPDACVTSNAVRALTTAEYFTSCIKLKKCNVILKKEPMLYHAEVTTFHKVIAELKNNWNTVAIFSHNPGITAFANSITNISFDNMPTCSMVVIEANCSEWDNFKSAEKKFKLFDYPKAY